MPFEIRPVWSADYQALGQVTADVYRVAYPPIEETAAAVREMYDVTDRVAGSETTFVAVDGGKIVGGVSFLLAGAKDGHAARPGEGEFRLLAVDEAARGRGVGRALVQACLDRAAALGLQRVVLNTGPDMLAAQRLYERMGFHLEPERDWEPVPGIRLLTYVIDVPAPRN
ncbi:GNAT family N-acetyltransferase [Actinoplanes sp. TBRC 11911]|uniref:GNAT family N-acetyltransferase n=1 Tax=Actinoplanes sp. TBRC 11911 TaxID=2729386 RepID=UPI00145F6990|nr:GNAT family N-acetyltransferase [Actinoplanes sp. TBRC 11911]NMO51712.1 GNAT family N-acetyltransferase [Actinoplanes sp. TBRC 11911]